MWDTTGRPWVLHSPRFASDELDPGHAAGPWFGHRFFVYDLIAWGRPKVVVELGTHFGVSFFAMCQATRDAGSATALHAVDTWEGDPHAGEYGDEVLQVVERTRAQLFSTLDVSLHRAQFSEALGEFEDGSVDLLHIDGFHTYEAVKDDYESWLPKLAEHGVVLFHDIAAWTGYGSADFWREISATHPSLTFDHSFGLGVLFPKGSEPFEYLLGGEFTRWHPYYAVKAGAFLGELQFRDQASLIDDRDAYILELEQQATVLRDQAGRATAALADAQSATIERRDDAGTAAGPPAPTAPPASIGARLVRKILRILRRGLRATNRQLGTNLHLGPSALFDLDARIASVFDADFYRARYPDITAAQVDALDHYRRRGWMERREPSALFWTDWYLRRYRNVADAGIDPLEYYLERGWLEGHDPSPLLRTRWYLDLYPDVRATGLSPLEHYWTIGYAEGRHANPEQRRRLIAAPQAATGARRSIAECELRTADQAARLVTLDGVARADVDLVTFDLWDTLVARARPADAGKLATARRISLRFGGSLRGPQSVWQLFEHRVRAEAAIAARTAHQEYRLVDVLAEHLAEVTRLGVRKARTAAAELAAEEAAEESAWSYRLDEVTATLEGLAERSDHPRLAILSDFYLGGDDLTAILVATGVDLPEGVEVLSSCDVHASKRVDGTLLALARERADVEPARHLHVGDNPLADVEQQVAGGGIACLLRLTPSRFPGPGELGSAALRTLLAAERDELLAVVDVLVADAWHTERERRAAHAGVLESFLPVMLVAAAVEDAIRRDVSTVHYLSREGVFLQQVHEVVAPILAGSLTPPGARHLAVSRRSTFGPSLESLDPGELARMWSQYADQSPRALFVSMGVEVDGVIAEAVEAVGLSMDELVHDVAHDDRVVSLLARPEVRAACTDALRERRVRLDAYLRQEADLSTTELVVVDVGWRGTIQDNLARLLPKHRLTGVYLGLFPYLNEQPANVEKRAIAFDGNAGDPFAHVSPPAALEAPLTPDLASVIDYSAPRDGRIVPVVEEEGPRAVQELAAYQRGVLAAAPRVAAWMVANGLTTDMLGDEINQMVVEYYSRPQGGVADIWFESTHDDTFGALNVSPFGKETPSRALLSYVGKPSEVSDEARRSNWVSGYRAWAPVRSIELLREMREELHDGAW